MALRLIERRGWLEYGKTKKRRARIALYLCECGNTFTAREDGVKSGNTSSCGCVKLKGNSATHRKSGTPIYYTWAHIKDRCDNTNHHAYHRYGGRGITYDVALKYFENFYEDMKDSWFEGATIDRIDNEGNYTKSNCQWLTRADNSAKRADDNKS